MTRREALTGTAAVAVISSAVSKAPTGVDKKLPWEIAQFLCREYGMKNVIIFGEAETGGAKMCCHAVYPDDDRETFDRACEIATTYGFEAVEGETVQYIPPNLI